MGTTCPAHHERIDANARTPDFGHCCVPLTMRLAAASASASWMAFANCGVVSMSTTPRTESTAARADQSVSMLNPLLAVVDAESGIWVECVAMVMSQAVSTYALRRGCVSNSPGEATGAWSACVVLDGLLVIVVPSPGVWVPRIAVRHPLRGRTERAVAQARRRQRPGPATATHIGAPNLLAHRENRRSCATPASPNWQSLGCSFDSCPGA